MDTIFEITERTIQGRATALFLYANESLPRWAVHRVQVQLRHIRSCVFDSLILGQLKGREARERIFEVIESRSQTYHVSKQPPKDYDGAIVVRLQTGPRRFAQYYVGFKLRKTDSESEPFTL